jgi:hypothetical protein
MCTLGCAPLRFFEIYITYQKKKKKLLQKLSWTAFLILMKSGFLRTNIGGHIS